VALRRGVEREKFFPRLGNKRKEKEKSSDEEKKRKTEEEKPGNALGMK
jgi:hypothetical protein